MRSEQKLGVSDGERQEVGFLIGDSVTRASSQRVAGD